MTIKLSSKDGGGLPKLAPDLNYIADTIQAGLNVTPYRETGFIDGTSGFVTAISLLGKFSFSALQIRNITTESYTIKLTVDGVIIWNSSRSLQEGTNIIGAIANNDTANSVAMMDAFACESSILLEVESTTDTSFKFRYLARPLS